MGFDLGDVVSGALGWVEDTLETAIKNPVETVLTGGLNTQVQASSNLFKEYTYRNGGRQALERASQLEADARKQAEMDSANKLAGQTMLASMPYSASFGQPNPSLLTQQQGRRTILGSF